ncbi:hypothetical protein SANTM175S_10928 [Streptomyces antimycoticus]
MRAVFHAAGIADEAPLLETTPARLREAMSGKAAGALALDRALGDTSDAFVLFSSISGIGAPPTRPGTPRATQPWTPAPPAVGPAAWRAPGWPGGRGPATAWSTRTWTAGCAASG